MGMWVWMWVGGWLWAMEMVMLSVTKVRAATDDIICLRTIFSPIHWLHATLTHAARCALCGADAYRMLIGAYRVLIGPYRGAYWCLESDAVPVYRF